MHDVWAEVGSGYLPHMALMHSPMHYIPHDRLSAADFRNNFVHSESDRKQVRRAVPWQSS